MLVKSWVWCREYIIGLLYDVKAYYRTFFFPMQILTMHKRAFYKTFNLTNENKHGSHKSNVMTQLTLQHPNVLLCFAEVFSKRWIFTHLWKFLHLHKAYFCVYRPATYKRHEMKCIQLHKPFLDMRYASCLLWTKKMLTKGQKQHFSEIALLPLMFSLSWF